MTTPCGPRGPPTHAPQGIHIPCRACTKHLALGRAVELLVGYAPLFCPLNIACRGVGLGWSFLPVSPLSYHCR